MIAVAAAGPSVGAHKIFIQELPLSTPEELSYKHQCRGSPRSQCKDLLRGFQQDFHTIFSQGFELDHVRIPRGFHKDLFKSSHKDLYKIMQTPLVTSRCSRQGPPENFTRSSYKDLLRSGSHKILIQEPPNEPVICKLLVQGPLREDFTRISTRSSVKDLNRIVQGPLREEVGWISTRARSCQHLQ